MLGRIVSFPKPSLPKPPFPSPGGSILDLVITGAKYLWNKFTDKKEKTSDIIANQRAMDQDTASINEVIAINSTFNELIQDLKGDIQKTEDDTLKELSYFFEEFIEYMQDHEEVFASRGIRVHKIVNKFEKVKRKLRGELSKKIHRDISLDNVACREILAMRAGDKKKEKMNYFIEKTFENALQDLIYDIQEELLDIVEDIEIAVEEGIALTELNIHEKAVVCEKLEESIASDINHKEDIIHQAIFKIYAMEEMKEMLNGGEN